ncbi:MAG TPA: acylneuraminate cytidylyltransferase family protein [Desulfuromonadaceae bacterium]|jgi:CMP-N-acetylneuraminic acid synthetase
MIEGKTILAVIPARGGSKRLPRKNVALLAGKPLIAWSIEAANGSKYVDEVMVTTDDDEIATASHIHGATVPFLRPKELATDTATTFDVIEHVIGFYKNELLKCYDIVLLLQPTSPLRTSKDIDDAIQYLVQKNADAIVSVCETDHSPLWANVLPDDLSMAGFIRDEVKNKRSQDLETCYRLNGAIYLCNIERLLSERTLLISNNIFGYVMQKEKSVDIDSIIDLKLCELLMKESSN